MDIVCAIVLQCTAGKTVLYVTKYATLLECYMSLVCMHVSCLRVPTIVGVHSWVDMGMPMVHMDMCFVLCKLIGVLVCIS